jgi:two-component system, NarL family, nitrate/nitrite response regulator NarL
MDSPPATIQWGGTIAGWATATVERLWHGEPMTPIRVLIIAGDPLVRAGLAALMAGEAQVNVVGQTAPDGALASQVPAYQPDVVLWDLGWNPATSLEWLADLTEVGPPVLALLAGEVNAAEVWVTGVRGLLVREAGGGLIATALLAVAQGLLVLDPTFASNLSHGPSLIAPSPLTETLTETLTPRELEVLRGLADGLANKEIARSLGISEHTVKFHVNAILGKLGAQSRTEAVVRATRAGLILL